MYPSASVASSRNTCEHDAALPPYNTPQLTKHDMYTRATHTHTQLHNTLTFHPDLWDAQHHNSGASVSGETTHGVCQHTLALPSTKCGPRRAPTSKDTSEGTRARPEVGRTAYRTPPSEGRELSPLGINHTCAR